MDSKRQLIALAGVLLFLVACEAQNPPPEYHPDWVIHSKVEFLTTDLASSRPALPVSAFRLTFPYVSGDLYGSPTIGALSHPAVGPDYSFAIDLNRTRDDLVRSLQPTEFVLDDMTIDPPDARIARLTPQALQADGIEQVGTTDWVDPASKERLMLVYFDRPARITGAVTHNGYTVSYNIRAGQAGYVWVGSVKIDDHELMYTDVPRPANLILALTPKDTDEGELVPVPGSAQSSSDSASSSSSGSQSSTSAEGLTSSSDDFDDLRGLDRLRREARVRVGLPER